MSNEPLYTDGYITERAYEIATALDTHYPDEASKQAEEIEAAMMMVRDDYEAKLTEYQSAYEYYIDLATKTAARIAELETRLERATAYTGIEGYPCPLCSYDDGVFVDFCEMHRLILHLRYTSEELEAQAESESIHTGMLYGDINNLKAQLAEARQGTWEPVPDGEYTMEGAGGTIYTLHVCCEGMELEEWAVVNEYRLCRRTTPQEPTP